MIVRQRVSVTLVKRRSWEVFEKQKEMQLVLKMDCGSCGVCQ